MQQFFLADITVQHRLGEGQFGVLGGDGGGGVCARTLWVTDTPDTCLFITVGEVYRGVWHSDEGDIDVALKYFKDLNEFTQVLASKRWREQRAQRERERARRERWER